MCVCVCVAVPLLTGGIWGGRLVLLLKCETWRGRAGRNRYTVGEGRVSLCGQGTVRLNFFLIFSFGCAVGCLVVLPWWGVGTEGPSVPSRVPVAV